jgi:hypothetical protein
MIEYMYAYMNTQHIYFVFNPLAQHIIRTLAIWADMRSVFILFCLNVFHSKVEVVRENQPPHCPRSKNLEIGNLSIIRF